MSQGENSKKPLIFISHITEEKTVAIEIKELIETTFKEKVEIFVSSDDVSIPLGDDWLRSVSYSLKNCKAILVVCSTISIDKPWINIEFGAGWVRDIPIIPICHSGMHPSKLPLPLKLQRGISVTKINDINFLISTIGKSIGMEKPSIDFSNFVEKITEFEGDYTFWIAINNAFSTIQSTFDRISYHDINLINAIKIAYQQGTNVILELNETDANSLEHDFKILEEKNILKLSIATGNKASSKITPVGTFYNYQIQILSEFGNVLSNKKFVFF